MADIRIHRDHQLGLAQARQVAWDWAEHAEQKFDMECTVLEGETSDTVQFSRSGVKGELIVAADHFDLKATLGFLLGAFSKTIEAEIEKNLDSLLGAAAAGGATVAAKTTAKGAASKAAAAPGAGKTAAGKAAPAKKAAAKK